MNTRQIIGICCMVYGVVGLTISLPALIKSLRMIKDAEENEKMAQKIQQNINRIVQQEQDRQKRLDEITDDLVKQIGEKGVANFDQSKVKELARLKWGVIN